MGRRGVREEIVAAAVAQFHAYGFNAAGVKDITDAAGVPKGSFYNHFESEEALAVVALEKYSAGCRLGDLTDTTADPLVRLRKHFEFLRDQTADLGFARGNLIGNFGIEIADHSEAIRHAVLQFLQTWATALMATITQAQALGEIRTEVDAWASARFILNAWQGTMIWVRSERSADAFEAFFETVFGTLLA